VKINTTTPTKTNIVMKHLYISFVFLLAFGASFSQTTTKNFVQSTSYQVPTQDGNTHAISGTNLQDDDKIETITYFDGLGRPIQSIAKQAGGNKQDIITPVEYDAFGREVKSYLPFANAAQAPGSGSLNFNNHNTLIQNLESFYANKFPEDAVSSGVINAYSEKFFEASPLNRVLEQAAPGNDWALSNGHTIKLSYNTNSHDPSNPGNPNNDNVVRFKVDFVGGNTENPQPVYDNFYLSGELFKNTTKDENWQSGQTNPKDHTTQEFKDAQGRVILKRTFKDNIAHDTYYVYDIFGNLTYVLPPEANASQGLPSNDDLNKLCYQYRYDKRNRLVEKKIPGKGWEYIVYDQLDRPVLTKDANLGGVNWLFTKYDAFDRVVYTGLLFAETTRALTQNAVDNQTVFNEQRLASPITLDDTSVYYSNNALSNFIIKKVYTINYYDNYNWDTCETFEADYTLDYISSNLSLNGNVIEKTFGGESWNAGFKTRGVISNDGFVQWRVTQTNKRVMVGLSKTVSAPNDHFNTIDYAIYTGAGTDARVFIYEEGVMQSLPNVYFEVDDEFKVERVGSQILYKKNDVVIHVSPTPSTGSLIGDSSFFDVGAKIEDVFIGYSALGQAFTSNTKSLPTGSKIRVLGTNHWICNQSYFNHKGQEIYSISANPYLNKKDNLSLQLDFTGKIIQAYNTHADIIVAKGGRPLVTQDFFTYDHTGRMLRQVQTINSQKQELLVKNHYDELGQLESKHVGGTLNDTSNYTNISGGVQVNGNVIVKTAAVTTWNEGLSTAQSISGDGYISFKPVSYLKEFMAGLTYNDTNTHFNTIAYALQFAWDGTVRVYENGTNRGTKNTFSPNDVFMVERRGTTIYYLKNGEPFYTSTVQTTNAPLFGDMSILHEGTQIKDFVLVDLQNQLQNVDYTYNIRGWLKSINNPDYMGNDLFAFKINYNTTSMGAGNNPLYNGNISETIWKTANDVNTSNLTRGYAYNYDPLNRIVSANYGTKTSAAFNLTGDYDVWGIDYDKNGNIDHLKRKGEGLLIDDLIYNYDGNQLLSVKDDSTNIEGFKDGNTSGNDYTYDANGNMLSDANKGIADISYNHLNLPTKVTITGQGSIEYVYDATGVKQSKKVSSLYGTPITTQYAGNFIYEITGVSTPKLKFFSTPEGYAEPTLKGFNYIYQYKDHLGNVRLSYKDNNGTLEIIEENNYYPFGLKHKGYNTNITSTNIALKRKFGGKEYQDELGLDWYDITARNYDPALGRWMNIDPLAEMMRRHSPYNYAFNNPIFFIDPDGLAPQAPEIEKVVPTGLYGEPLTDCACTHSFFGESGGGEDSEITITFGESTITINPNSEEINIVNIDSDNPTPSITVRFDGKNFVVIIAVKFENIIDFLPDFTFNAEFSKNFTTGSSAAKAKAENKLSLNDIDAKFNVEYNVVFKDGQWTLGKNPTFKGSLEHTFSSTDSFSFDNATVVAGVELDAKNKFNLFGQFNMSNLPPSSYNPRFGRRISLSNKFNFKSKAFDFAPSYQLLFINNP
jgi:RHS repeat-associated protein